MNDLEAYEGLQLELAALEEQHMEDLSRTTEEQQQRAAREQRMAELRHQLDGLGAQLTEHELRNAHQQGLLEADQLRRAQLSSETEINRLVLELVTTLRNRLELDRWIAEHWAGLALQREKELADHQDLPAIPERPTPLTYKPRLPSEHGLYGGIADVVARRLVELKKAGHLEATL